MGVGDEALGVIPGRTAPSADLGGKSQLAPPPMCRFGMYANLYVSTGSSKYSNENFED